jgi:hypothetical protein
VSNEWYLIKLLLRHHIVVDRFWYYIAKLSIKRIDDAEGRVIMTVFLLLFNENNILKLIKLKNLFFW